MEFFAFIVYCVLRLFISFTMQIYDKIFYIASDILSFFTFSWFQLSRLTANHLKISKMLIILGSFCAEDFP